MINNNKQPIALLEVKTAKGTKLIHPAEIMYLKANNKHTTVCFGNNEKLETHHLLKWYNENLPIPDFCRCHDSFMINCTYIEYMCGTHFILKGNVNISISRERKSYAIQCYGMVVQRKGGENCRNHDLYD